MEDWFEIANDIAMELAEEASRELAEDIARKIALEIVPEVARLPHGDRYRKVEDLMRSERVKELRNAIEKDAEARKQQLIARRLSSPDLLAQIDKSSQSTSRRQEIREMVEMRLNDRVNERVEEIVDERVGELVDELIFMMGSESA